MFRNILTHTLALTVGAGVVAAVAYSGFLPFGNTPPDYEKAAAEIVERFKATRYEPPLRGSMVLAASSEQGKLALKAVIADEAQTQSLKERAEQFLNESLELGRAFPVRPPEVQGTVVSVKAVSLENARVDGAYYDPAGKLLLIGAALPLKGENAQSVRDRLEKKLTTVKLSALPDGKPPTVGLDARLFRIVDDAPVQLAKTVSGVSVSSLSFDASGTLTVAMARPEKGPDPDAAIRAELVRLGLLGQQGEARLRIIDETKLAGLLRGVFAADSTGKHVWIEKARVDGRTVTLTCFWLQDASEAAMKDLRAVIKEKAKLAGVLGAEPQIAFAPKARQLLLRTALRKAFSESSDVRLQEAEISDVRFDARGGIEVESSEKPEVKQLIKDLAATLVKGQPAAPPGEEEQEETVALRMADEPPGAAPIGEKARQLREKLARDPAGRYFRVDARKQRLGEEAILDVSGVLLFQSADQPALAMQLEGLKNLCKSGSSKAVQIKTSNKQAASDPVKQWQKRVGQVPGLAEVLLLDAWYQADGKLRLVGCVKSDKQRQQLVEWVKRNEAGVDRSVWEPAGLDASHMALKADLPDWKLLCQGVLAMQPPDGLAETSRVTHFAWERQSAKRQEPRVQLVAFRPGLEEAGRGKIRELLSAPLRRAFSPAAKAALEQAGDRTGEIELVGVTVDDQSKRDSAPMFVALSREFVKVPGAWLASARFTADGKLLLKGGVLKAEQATMLADAALALYKKAEDKVDPATPPLAVDSRLSVYSPEKLRDAIQAALAASPDFDHVRIDQVRFGQVEPSFKPTLLLGGIGLHDPRLQVGRPANEGFLTPAATAARIAAEKHLSLEGFAVNIRQVPVVNSPVKKAQDSLAEVFGRKKLYLVERLSYDARGNLLFTERLLPKEDLARAAAALESALSTAAKKDAPAALRPGTKAVRKGMPRPAAPAELIGYLQGKLADAESGKAAHQTRIDEAWIAYASAEARAALNLSGVCLAQGGKPSADALLRREALKWIKDRPLAVEEVDAKQVIPLSSSLRQLQASLAADTAFDGTLLIAPRYDAMGKLSFQGRRRKGTGGKLGDHLLKLEAAKQMIGPKDTAAGLAGALKDVDWPAWLSQARNALATGSPLLTQTRLDRAYFAYPAMGERPELVLQVVCLDPARDAKELLKQAGARLREVLAQPEFGFVSAGLPTPRLAGDPFVENPLVHLQAKAVDAGLDGVLFTHAAFAADGRLLLGLSLHSSKPQLPPVEAMVKETPRLLAGALSASTPEPKWKLVPREDLPDWKKFVEAQRQTLRAGDTGAPLNVGRYTRLDRARLVLESPGHARLRWDGVCIHPGRQAEAVAARLAGPPVAPPATPRTELERRLKDSARELRVKGVEFKADAGKIALLANPKYVWQTVSNEATPANDGLLFEDAYYDGATLRVAVLVASDKQKKVAADRVSTLDKKVAGTTKPQFDFHPFDLKSLLRSLQAGARREKPALADRVRIDRGYFAYPALTGTVEFLVSGLMLHEGDDEVGLASDKAALEKVLAHQFPPGTVNPAAGRPVTRPRLTPIRNLARGLQERIASDPALDGVALVASRFGKEDRLVLAGVWRGPEQQEPLRKLATDYLKELQRGVFDQNEFTFDCQQVDTAALLRQMRLWMVDNVDEGFADRVYFNAGARLAIAASSPSAGDKGRIGDKLARLLEKHPYFKGRAVLSKEGLVAGKPEVLLALRPGVAKLLRQQVQWPANGTPPADTRWDGMLVRRCYYTPEGKLGVEGVCDGAAQRAALNTLLSNLAAESPFREALEKGRVLERLKAVPLASMLKRIRRVMPAYPVLDGLVAEGAAQDVNGRLRLRVRRVGSLDGERRERAEKLLTAMLLEHPEWKARVDGKERVTGDAPPDAPAGRGGLTLSITVRKSKQSALATHSMLERALRDLTLAARDEDQGADFHLPRSLYAARRPQWGPSGVPPQNARAISGKELDVVLLHDPANSLAWYLRGMLGLLKGDREAGERDLARCARLDSGHLNPDRAKKTELLQGAARRLADSLLRKQARSIKDGVFPPTLRLYAPTE